MNRLRQLQHEFGLVILALRTPRIIWRVLWTKFWTFYWRCFVGSMGKHVQIAPSVRIHRPKNVFIGDGVVISEHVDIGSENATGKLRIGNNVQINRRCIIDHSGDVDIGEGTLISEEAALLSHSHGYDPHQQSRGIPKSVGANCWIGFRAIIGENATVLADHVIVATASVVISPCEKPNSLYGGIPAKWIKSIETS